MRPSTLLLLVCLAAAGLGTACAQNGTVIPARNTTTGGGVQTNATAESSSCAVRLSPSICILVFPGVDFDSCSDQANSVGEEFIGTNDPACLWPIPQSCSGVSSASGQSLDSCPTQTIRVINSLSQQSAFVQALALNHPFRNDDEDALDILESTGSDDGSDD